MIGNKKSGLLFITFKLYLKSKTSLDVIAKYKNHEKVLELIWFTQRSFFNGKVTVCCLFLSVKSV